jgi:hypothetical protein
MPHIEDGGVGRQSGRILQMMRRPAVGEARWDDILGHGNKPDLDAVVWIDSIWVPVMSLVNPLRVLLTSVLLATLLPCLPVLARGNDLTISDGGGEMLQVKNPLFGRKFRLVKDRFGDGFAGKKGILGGEEIDMSLLGNQVRNHKGLLGNSQMSGSTIFGDKFISKKGIFGRRVTAVDLSGSGNLIKSFFAKKSSLQPLNDNPPGQASR